MMKSGIITGALLVVSSLAYGQNSANTIPSTERKVMEENGEHQPDSLKVGNNTYLMLKDFKGHAKPEDEAVPQKAAPKQKDQKIERDPR